MKQSKEISLPFNMDRNQRLAIETAKQSWLSSPSNQVERIPLEREKAESGQVTSVVKYGPGSRFPTHPHPLGEEIFVLEGEFADENGRYPAGTYLRNPPGSKHSPFSEKGCTLFVKLNQFHPEDKQTLVIDTKSQAWLPGHGRLKVLPLHQFQEQNTALVHWPAGETFIPHTHFGGEEIFVIQGEFRDEYGEYPQGSWIRSPHLSKHHPSTKIETIILVKTGHL
jgi:anti-sigma factor ChrR (cupin superfamily)